MEHFICIAIFALGMLIGQSIKKRPAQKGTEISVDDFCEKVAEKITKRLDI